MSARVLTRPQARIDLTEQAEYIAADNVDAAIRFLDAAEREFAMLAETPGAGAKQAFRRKELADVRCWSIGGFDNHLVFYRPVRGGIEVLRVLHGARDIGAILDT